MKVLICPSYLRETTLRNLLEKEKCSFLPNQKVLPFSAYTNTLEEDNPYFLATQLALQLKSKETKFPIYHALFSYPRFLLELITFALECHQYNISADELPKTDEAEKELSELIACSLSLLKTSKENSSDDEITYVHTFIPSIYEAKTVDLWKKQGAVIEDFSTSSITPNKQYKVALNPRQEIECVAQAIAQHAKPEDVTLICPDSSSYYLVEQIFPRYGIPFSTIGDSLSSSLTETFALMVEVSLLHQDASLVQLAHRSPFGDNLTPKQKQDLENSLHPDEIILGNDEDAYKDLASLLTQYASPLETCSAALELLKKAVNSNAKVRIYHEIRKTVLSTLEINPTVEVPGLLLEQIRSISLPLSSITAQGVCVTTLTQPVGTRKITFLTGLTQSNYPGFSPKNGLFDEAYLKETPYPSLEERVALYMGELQWIHHSATEQIFYSYACSSYDGKASEVPFELEQQMKNEDQVFEAWNPISNNPSLYRSPKLDASLAYPLYTKDKILTTSVSSLERYARCPYSYFLGKGLGIADPEGDFLPANFIGSVQHTVMETLVGKDPLHYPEASEEELRTIIHPLFQEKEQTFPKRIQTIQACETRMVHGLLLTFRFLKDFEASTSFKPFHGSEGLEDKFEVDFLVKKDFTVRMRGTIDRLQVYNNLLAILDYKSSDKSLSEVKVKNGLQLQLLVYLLVALQLHEDYLPAGAYYCSLKNGHPEVLALNLRRTGEDAYDEMGDFSLFKKDHQLSGWTLNPVVEWDEDATHTIGFKVKDDFASSDAKHQPKLENLETAVQEVVGNLAEEILNGNISIDPVEEACTFCPFRAVCHFKGGYRTPSPLTSTPILGKEAKE